jgi:processive 1,2-diacylglycerol beta-glucosyltransferase
MSARVLILTAGFGEGHNAAARGLAAACDLLAGPGTARICDVFALAAPTTNRLVRRAYLALINRAPALWGSAYRTLDRTDLLPRSLGLLGREHRILAALVARERPTVICCTFPAYAFMLESLNSAGRDGATLYNIVTDSISINSVWWRARCDGWFVPNEDTADVVRAAGIAPERIFVSGFPVPPQLADLADRIHPPSLVSGVAPRVLHIVNSGTRRAEETARGLMQESGWDLTIAVGRDERLRRRLLHATRQRAASIRIMGWTDQIPRLLLWHHVVVSKAGGATTQEAIAARCPMIVNQIVPGQEEGNYELLRRHGVGAYAPTPEAVVGELRRAFAANGLAWLSWRNRLSQLARPDAARAIARAILRPPVAASPPPHENTLHL